MLEYLYDQLGNRMARLDHVPDRQTHYVYDTDWDPVAESWRPGLYFEPDPPEYVTRNNRLLEYREYGPV